MTRPRIRLPLFLPLLALACAAVGATTAGAAIRDGVTITPAAGAGQVDPGVNGTHGVYNFTVAFAGGDDVGAGFVAGPKAGHCIEGSVFSGPGGGRLLTGTEGSDLSLANDDPANLADDLGGRNRLEWLLLSSRRAMLDTPAGAQRDAEATAHQIAVWRLTNPGTAPTEPGDGAYNTRATQLVNDSATYGASVGQAPAISPVGADVCAGANRTLRVTGAPLTTVTLAITAGQGVFANGTVAAGGQQTVVTLGANGSADVVLTGSAAGAVSVRGTFEAVTLVQAENLDPQTGQDFAYVEVRPQLVDASVQFTNCTPVTPTTPAGTPAVQPVAPVNQPVVTGTQTTRLRITKAAPRNARVRAAVSYGITVTNVGTVAALNVVITDPLPGGMAVVSIPANARLVKGALRWSIGTLQPGQRVTVRAVLRNTVNVARTRCNVARASAGNAPTVTGRVCTRFTRIAGVTRIPVVTG